MPETFNPPPRRRRVRCQRAPGRRYGAAFAAAAPRAARVAYSAFLKVSDHCPHCGEELHHHRADDFPAYLVIVIVGHILVPIVLVVETEIASAIWVSMTLWPLIALAMALCLLQPVKGAVVAIQWYGGMHGFEEAKKAARSQRPPRARSPETQSRISPRSL